MNKNDFGNRSESSELTFKNSFEQQQQQQKQTSMRWQNFLLFNGTILWMIKKKEKLN